MQTIKALAVLSAGSLLFTGCVPFGCGAPADPTDVQAFVLTASGTATAPETIEGIAAAPDGVWLLELGNTYELVELDRVGGIEKRHIALDDRIAFGLAWDGTALWVGSRDFETGAATAKRIDPATGATLATIALPAAATDLAYDGTYLIVVQGLGDYEAYAPATGALASSVPVYQLDAVATVAYHDGETWVAQPGSTALIYDNGGTLFAKTSSDAFTAAGAHMTFVGDTLVIAQGSALHTYAVDRTAPTL
ncbi:MAG TPA: hypothetical protein VL463_07815 [Kofleriaceae bacterium]|jgi:hypothetical protein|nr:hypothetical protein [Kofleriaceae bacterium]